MAMKWEPSWIDIASTCTICFCFTSSFVGTIVIDFVHDLVVATATTTTNVAAAAADQRGGQGRMRTGSGDRYHYGKVVGNRLTVDDNHPCSPPPQGNDDDEGGLAQEAVAAMTMNMAARVRASMTT